MRAPGASKVSGWRTSAVRVRALVRKEFRQVLRDPSSIAIGIVLPAVLILIFGFGLSLDIRNVPIAVLNGDPSAEARDLAARFFLSPYFRSQFVRTEHEARNLLTARQVDGVIRIREDFARQLQLGDAQIQVLVYGVDANRARIVEGYARSTVALWAAVRASEGLLPISVGPVGVESRLWFNEDGESRHFLVPGMVVLVMTIVGATLTALVMAREWERGTFEALFVTPVRPGEILVGKTVPYFALGMLGLALCVLAAHHLFGVPLRGSLSILCGVSMLYLLVTLGIGLLISSSVRNQLLASQITIVSTFLPATLLSGFQYDIRSMPVAVQGLTYLLPARYFVALLQTLFLAGDVWTVIWPNTAVLALMAAILALLTRRVVRKSLE